MEDWTPIDVILLREIDEEQQLRDVARQRSKAVQVKALQVAQQASIPQPNPQPAQTHLGYIEKTVERAGIGCLVQGVGLILLFLFPIGTVVGVVLLLIGSSMAKKFLCSVCGTKLAHNKVAMCPGCRCTFVR